MTVTEKASRRVISGFGWTNPLTHTFELENSTHLKVYADDVELVLGVDYSITGVGVDSGYSVTITDPLDWSPDVWVLSVEPPINQADDVSLGGVFGARFEESLDAMARRVQRVWNGVQRSWKVPMTTAVGEAPTMDVLAEGHFWKADADGNMVDGGSAADISGAQGWASSAAASAIAAASSAVNAALSAALAAALAAGLNLPSIASTDIHKNLKVKADYSGYRFSRNPFYDPYDYSANGGGSVDDTAALLACQTAANADEGIRPVGAPAGRGVSIVPPGLFKTSGITSQNTGEKWLGLGGTLTAQAADQVVMTVQHSLCTVEAFTMVQSFRPTINKGVFQHSAGADCTFRKLSIVGGYYGIDCSGGGDSVWMDNKITVAAADYLYVHHYNGFWGIRNKFDGAYPTGTQPVDANLKGAWTTATAYSLNDMVYANGWWFQCSTAGTSAGTGTGPLPTAKYPSEAAIVDGAGTLRWKTHRSVNASGILIESDSFINFFWLVDISGGHIYGVKLINSTGTYAPQTIKFLDACEMGSNMVFGVWAEDADDLEIKSCIIDGTLNKTIGAGVTTSNCRGVSVHNNMIRQHLTGVNIGPTTTGAAIDFNGFGGVTDWCIQFTANTVGFSAIGNQCGDAVWGANANGIRVRAGTSDEYIVALNRGRGITGVRWADFGTGLNKAWDLNV